MCCVLCAEPFEHGGDLSACVLCAEPFGHGGDLSACVLCAAVSHLGMEVISQRVCCVPQ